MLTCFLSTFQNIEDCKIHRADEAIAVGCFHILFKNLEIEICKIIILPVALYSYKSKTCSSSHKGRT
jgi:hypothetical protein